MARPSKKNEVVNEDGGQLVNDVQPVEAPTNSSREPSDRELELMRLYPQYEEIWITPDGFVHPKGAAKYLIQGATLYKNKFYNK